VEDGSGWGDFEVGFMIDMRFIDFMRKINSDLVHGFLHFCEAACGTTWLPDW
jgi:hypothetical protein